MAYTDFLTGVHNRAYMDKTIAKLNGTGEWIGVVVADIDNFKSINDTYNHAVGDEVIRHFASTLKQFLKEGDFLFRSGGEEFTMFLRHRTFEESVRLVEEIREAVRRSTVLVDYMAAKRPIAYTSSFGLYFCQAEGTMSIEKAYIYADHLLLRSKESGKNKVSAQCGELRDGAAPFCFLRTVRPKQKRRSHHTLTKNGAILGCTAKANFFILFSNG